MRCLRLLLLRFAGLCRRRFVLARLLGVFVFLDAPDQIVLFETVVTFESQTIQDRLEFLYRKSSQIFGNFNGPLRFRLGGRLLGLLPLHAGAVLGGVPCCCIFASSTVFGPFHFYLLSPVSNSNLQTYPIISSPLLVISKCSPRLVHFLEHFISTTFIWMMH